MTNDMVEFYINKTFDLATKKVERMARKILRENPNYKEFIMAMGIWVFTDRSGYSIHNNEDIPCGQLSDFIEKWDEILHLTGNPMRFTARGKVITDW